MEPDPIDVRYSLGDSLDRLVAFIPDLIAGLLVLLIGYILAKVLARMTRPLLHRVGFDRFVHRLGFVREHDSRAASSGVASLVFALILLGAVMQAARFWELRAVEVGIARLFAYLPHVLGAVLIFGVALWFGNLVRDRMLQRAATTTAPETTVGGNRLVAVSVRAGILTLGAFMALRELQVGAEIVTIGFTLALGAIAVAAALAFGLGSRDVAGRAMERWYERGTRTKQGGATRMPISGQPI